MSQPQFPGTAGSPHEPSPPAPESSRPPSSRRWLLWLTVSMLIAVAVLGGVFIVVGNDAYVAGRVWLTFFLVVCFAGAVILDASTNGPNRWYMPVSTIINSFLLIIGMLKIWTTFLQTEQFDYGTYDDYGGLINGPLQFFRWVGIVILMRLALLVTQIGWIHFVKRARTAVTMKAALVDLVLVWVTTLIIVIPLAFPVGGWPGWWWRTAAATVLAAAILSIIPVVFRAFEPKPPKSPVAQYPPGFYRGVPPRGSGSGPQPPFPPQNPQPWPGQPSPPGPYPQQGQPSPQQWAAPQPGQPQQPGQPPWRPGQPGQPPQQPGRPPQQPGQQP
jgi:hypothetical protein